MRVARLLRMGQRGLMGNFLIALLVLVWASAPGARAEVAFAPVFNTSAVLQCEMPVNVWGRSAPGTGLEIQLDGKKVAEAKADAGGNWKAILPGQPPGGPHSLEAVSGENSAKLEDILFGEVWLAAGQSNMVLPVGPSLGGAEALKRENPGIRFLKVPQKTGLPVENAFTADDLKWRVLKPGPPSRDNDFSAVAFYFAEALHQGTGRPIGIIQSAYGGTPAEAWTSLDMLEGQPELKKYARATRQALELKKTREQWQEEISTWDQFVAALTEWKKGGSSGLRPKEPTRAAAGNPWSPRSPGVLFENMIAPLVPYTTRGVIWYQGEGNATKPDEYQVLFPTMIEGWRKLWGRPDWPFLFVQLSAFETPSAGDWAGLRAAQTFTRDTVPHTGMAVSIDCGEKNNIHPKRKQPVGERLARLALADVYGKTIASRGPTFQAMEKSNGSLRINFQGFENGLQTSVGKPDVPGFEVAGPDGVFHAAQAKIVSTSAVELTCAETADPVSARYAWANWPEPPVTLQNSAGLPAEPFSKIAK